MSNNKTDIKKYSVGYCKPPKSGQFKKGQSGNPMGKVKGSQNIMTLLEKALRTQVIINENGHRKTITKQEAIILQIVNKAASGDNRSIQQFLNLALALEGRQAMNATPELPITEADRETLQQIAGRMKMIIKTKGE